MSQAKKTQTAADLYALRCAGMQRGRETMKASMSDHQRKRMHGLGGYTSYRNGNRGRDYLKTEAIPGLNGNGTLHRFVARERPIRKPPQQRIPKPISLSDALEQLNAV
jgi:hypothetical protein